MIHMSDDCGQLVCAVVEGLPCGICFVSMDDEERVLYANRAFLNIMGASSFQELVSWRGNSFEAFTGVKYIPLRQRYEAVGEASFHFFLRSRDGEAFSAEGMVGKEEVASLGKVWCLSCIRCRKKAEKKIEETELLMNRETFYPAVTRLAEEDVKHHIFGGRAPVYFNLTNFKVYNSTHGRQAGDELIHFLADRLRVHFPHALIAHLTGDTFALLAPHQDVSKRIEAVAREVAGYTEDSSVRLKAGVHIFDSSSVEVNENGIHLLFDMAKIAADSIKDDAGRTWAFYEKSMGKNLADKAYVLGNFDKALEKGYIKVYYQLIIRSFTGKVSSVEALARWEDPERGRIMPSVFVPVLEEARLIHRLDAYVIEQIARLYVFLKENRRPFIPISVNLSAMDFETMNPFALVESMVKKYEVPRNFFHIEITESALNSNSGRLKKEISRFQKAGYECWLDDFGSGYSSLNVLKSYHFDTLKLDMAFQKNMNDQGRRIISSIIFMAKKLGIHTLAEGVETKEQAEFLKNLGCEKIQGYYYSKPLPYEESYRSVISRQMDIETASEASLLDKVGLANVISENPAGMFIYDGKNLGILLENQASRRAASFLTAQYFMRDGVRVIQLDAPAAHQFHELIGRSSRSGKAEFINYVFHGQYVHCSMKVLAAEEGICAGKFEYYHMFDRDEMKLTSHMDKLLRHLFIIYDGLYVFRKETNRVEVVESMNRIAQSGDTIPMERFLTLEQFIHEKDRQEFHRLMDWDYLEREGKKSNRNAVTGLLRLQTEDGSFRWKEFDFAFMGSSGGGDVILGVKDTVLDNADDRDRVLSDYAASFGFLTDKEKTLEKGKNLLSAFASSSEICFFWKDRNRRFLGASQAFLQCYGLKQEDILGKTDEDMGWHIDGSRYRGEEEKVLTKGIISRRVMGNCIIRGKVHRIRATKFPVYEGNEIAGLAGYFTDVENEGRLELENRQLSFKDPETGLSNYRGLFMSGLAFYANYKTHGENYGGIFMDIPELDRAGSIYGPVLREKLLHRLAEEVSRFFGHRESLAHLGSGRFCVLLKMENTEDIRRRMLDLSNRIHSIHQVDGRNVTPFLQYALALGSEARNVDEFFHLLAYRLMEAEREKYGEAIYTGDRIAFDRQVFDTSSEQIMISDLDNYSLLYMNQAGLRDLGLPADYDYSGKTCYELICGNHRPCDICPQALLRRDRFYTQTFHNRNTGRDYLIQHTLISWHGKNCHFETAVNLGSYVEREYKKNYLLFKEIAVNDAIEAGLSEGSPHEGLMHMLARTGRILEAEKACIFEEQADGTLKNTYEWCRKGIAPTMAQYQHVPMELAKPIYDRFGPDQVAIIDDVEQAARDYGLTGSFYRPGLKRLISGHLITGGKSLGYTEIVNPSEKTMKEASPLLATLTRFAAILLRNRNTMDELKKISHVDQLTGLMNRRSFMECVRALPEGKQVAFFFGDMNGLKQINDTKGHEAGDEALVNLSRIMAAMVGRKRAFRMGGDEFIMVLEDGDAEKAEQLERELKEKLHLQGLSIAMGCALRTAPIHDIDSLITEMDKKMYDDKRNPRK
ncbi:EAL domain-containing protein [Dialister sp.]|uniref:EAL domain-containing protein n=1 Tax=Dialister sp. TaxID=1955814 RepID=UPI003F10A430